MSKGSGVPQNPTPTVFSPQFRGHSSCGSTPLDEEDANVPHLVDGIIEPVNVKVVHPLGMDKGQGGAQLGLAGGRRDN